MKSDSDSTIETRVCNWSNRPVLLFRMHSDKWQADTTINCTANVSKQSWLNLRYHSGICLGGLMKTTKAAFEESGLRDHDLGPRLWNTIRSPDHYIVQFTPCCNVVQVTIMVQYARMACVYRHKLQTLFKGLWLRTMNGTGWGKYLKKKPPWF